MVAEKGGRKRKEKRRKMRVSIEARTRETGIQLCSPGYMVDLAATKRSILQIYTTTFI
jgi:hypothetical protein